MILASFAEVLSIGAVLPFLGALTAPERLFQHPLMQPLIHGFGLTEPKQLLLPLTIVFVIAAVISGIMRLMLLWAQTRLSYAIGSDLSNRIYHRTLYQPYSTHITRNSSEVIAGILIKAKTVVSGAILPTLTIISSSLMMVAILITLIAIEPAVAFVAFSGLGAIYALLVLVAKKYLAENSKRVSSAQNQVLKVLHEGLGGIRDVLIDGKQDIYLNIYRSIDLMLRRAIANIHIIGGAPRFGIEAFGLMLIAVLAYSLAVQSEGISSTIPTLGALALGAQRLLPVLQQAYAGWTSMRGSQASLADALELLDQPLPAYTDAPLPPPVLFQHKITLNKLGFRYSDKAPWVLRELDVTITKGSRVGFIGSTGSGKSTLLDIIMALLYPSEGSLAIDGETITPQNHRAWQAHIAHVPQEIFLVDSTVAENIAFGVPLNHIDFDRVRQAAKKAQIADTIETWESQYQTVVGERGVRLSGGQRQRIGIARALYKQADVIVFDEATSALDNDTEIDVMKAIESLSNELTVLIVAHRLSTLKNCTVIIELEDGKIKRSGSYQKIISEASAVF
jgi:ABC-type bacteriocin/lantibiotic exporter with double-glycine peptidase domain